MSKNNAPTQHYFAEGRRQPNGCLSWAAVLAVGGGVLFGVPALVNEAGAVLVHQDATSAAQAGDAAKAQTLDDEATKLMLDNIEELVEGGGLAVMGGTFWGLSYVFSSKESGKIIAIPSPADPNGQQ